MDKNFTKILLHWHLTTNTRKMPWKGEKNPYKIWLSEIILQQTRVDQGIAYYEKFINKYPTIKHLAAANDTEVYKLWEGLGYYNRCKNLLYTARFIVKHCNSIFPTKHTDLLKLKGVGAYTAAAIASFAYNLPYAVLDGNVFRVLARVFAINTAIDSSNGKKIFEELAFKVLDKSQSAIYNQAIMDFGATVCKPALPLCNTCFLQNTCIAYKNGWVNELPKKEKRLTKKARYISYILFKYNDTILVKKRIAKDIWQNLYEFYSVETDVVTNWTETFTQNWLNNYLQIKNANVQYISKYNQQILTHQKVKGQCIVVNLKKMPKLLQHYELVNSTELKKLAFSKYINQFLEEKDLLNLINN